MWCLARLKGWNSPADGGGRGEEGQAEVEFVLTILLFLATILAFVELTWYWWGHLTVAVALHDGVATVGRTGSVDAGVEEMRRLVYAALDERRADSVMAHTVFQVNEVQRMASGRVDAPWVPLLFPLPESLRPFVRASSTQRLEGFYPGQPPYWPWE